MGKLSLKDKKKKRGRDAGISLNIESVEVEPKKLKKEAGEKKEKRDPKDKVRLTKAVRLARGKTTDVVMTAEDHAAKEAARTNSVPSKNQNSKIVHYHLSRC